MANDAILFSHFSALLTRRAHQHPDKIALTFLGDGDSVTEELSFAQLEQRVQTLACRLAAQAAPGERALLLYPSGPDYVVAFLACLRAGVIAVPAYPPESASPHHTQRLLTILQDASASLVLTAEAMLPGLQQLLAQEEVWRGVALLATDHSEADHLATNDAAQWTAPAIHAGAVAFLQYTSGSTSQPKGVRVTHGNLIANQQAIQSAFGIGDGDTIVSWLPLYHDMGLIGGLLQPLFSGVRLVLLSPRHFLERPLRWLKAISTFGGTVSGGPDFAYRLCTERIPAQQLAALDLRSWKLAFSGSEPIRADTLRAFGEKFAAAGFDRHALYPCYGLAEATLLVTGARRGAGFHAVQADAAALAQHRFVTSATTSADGVELISSGAVQPGHLLALMEPDLLQPVASGAVGEIWFHGPSVADGYWNQQEATAASFVQHDGRRWLRTGDMGLLQEGQLFVTGRRKDMIIVRGQNLYPQDIELAVENEIELVRKGRVAAFAVRLAGREGIGIAAEIGRSTQKLTDPQALAASIAEVVGRHCQEPASVVVLLNPGGLPKTTSGKLQRSACAARWESNQLDAYAVITAGKLTSPAATPSTVAATPFDDALARMGRLWDQVLGSSGAGAADSFFALGGSSLTAAHIAARVQAEFGVEVNLAWLFETRTLAEFCERVTRAQTEAGNDAVLPLRPRDATQLHATSFAQRGMWFLWRMAPHSPAYNIAGSLAWRGALDVAALEQALNALAQRHTGLRTRFEDGYGNDGRCRQTVLETPPPALQHEHLDELAAAARPAAVRASIRQLASQPFDLSTGPVWRARLIRVAADEHVLAVAIHHIVADGASMQILIRDLVALYQAAVRGLSSNSAGLPALPVDYADYAVWQEQRLQRQDAQRMQRELAYWTTQLSGAAVVLELPLDRPRPPQQSYQGATVGFTLTSATAGTLQRFARASNATPFMVLCAAFNVLLHRYSGQADVRVGVPFSNRLQADTENLVGMFVNTLVLRSSWQPQQGFTEVLAQMRSTTLQAQAHADLPFDRLVEALQPQRSLAHSPLFQAMFNHQERRAVVETGDPALDIRVMAEDGDITKFDLCLNTVDDGAGGISGVFVYASDLFDASSIERLAGNFVALLEQLLAAPQRSVGAIELMDDVQIKQVLAWSRGAQQPEQEARIHEEIAAQAAATPDATALIFGAQRMSYAELNRRADCLAQQLVEQGAGPDVVVGLLLQRSFDLVVGLLGILKSGAAYLPLDADAPPARLRYMAEDAGLRLLVTHGAASESLQADSLLGLPTIDLDTVDWTATPHTEHRAGPAPDNLAYVLYTSGSTGQPKGVANTHGALTRRLQWMQQEYALGADETLLHKTPVSFDVSVWEILWTLSRGAQLVLAAPGEHRDPQGLARLIREHAVSTVHFVPSMLRLFIAQDEVSSLRSLKRLFSGGEALTRELQAQVLQRLPGVRFDNRYGPTEALINASYWTCRAEAHAGVPIGRPLADTALYVLDAQLKLVPASVAGDLYIGGAALARGYLGRSALSAQRFIPDPYGDVPGSRLYRSGDRARWRVDGVLEYLGRDDHQVKIRGFRIEPGEIETLLRAAPGVREAAVLACEGPGGLRLAAYVALDQERDVALLKKELAAQLPEYMVPAVFVRLPRLPLMANGKLDRAALPAPTWESRDYVAPRTVAEKAVAQLWQDLLQVERAGLGDAFLDLGGHSLLATQVVSRLRQQFNIDLPLRALFEAEDLQAFALCVQDCIDQGQHSRQPPLLPVQRDAALALSYSQERMWFLWNMEPLGASYNVGGAVRLRGELDVTALRAALQALVMRHEGLRTTFPSEQGQARQCVAPEAGVFLQEHDFSVGDMRENERKVAAFAEQEAHRPFDLAQGPLMRIHLLRLAQAHHLLLVSIHHIVAEGWAMDVFADEFSQLYRDFSQGRAATLPPLAIQYPDFAAWQRAWLGGGEGARQLAYWKQRLGNEHPVLELPFDHARPAVQQFEGDFVTMELPPALAAEVAAFNRRQGVTLFMTVMTAMMALLHRYSGQADLRIGYPIANRTRPEFERLIGGFLNTQVLQCDIDAGMTAADLLAAVREAALEAQAHQDVPFHAIVDELRPQRSASHSPLFQVMCNVQRWRFQQTREVAPGLQLEFEGNDAKTAKFDLLLDVTDIDGRFACVFSYQTALFNRATIERLARHWRGLLSEIVRRPDTLLYQLPLLESAERQQLLAASSHAQSRFEVSESLPARFERQVARRGQAIAVSAEEGSLSYAALNARANQLARALRQQGVGPDVLVGLAVQRSLDTIVGMLGILKAGGAYLPLDPDYPPERLAFMLADARPALVLTQARVRDALPATDVPVWCLDSDWESIAVQEAHDLQVAVHPANLAYCIYTSGSTGKPKGALLTHANAQRLFLATESQFGFGDHDVWTMFHSYAFDFSVWEVFGALLHGGRLVVVPYLTSRSPADFLALLQRENVTVLNQTPSAFRQLMQVPGLYQGGVPDSLRYVVFGGEALDLPGLRPWFAQRGETMPTLVNMYGITETTVHVSWRLLTAADAALAVSPVGAPLADLYWHVLDADLEPAPAGVKGELYIGGAGLARGYLGRQALTAERFLPDPFSALAGARLYRTGDTARRTAEGEMEYLGRADSQVKIRGFRIEPGEIEARLREHPQVADAVVVARKDDSGHAQLVAYVVANAQGAMTAASALQEDLRACLNACLPAYMVPSAFVLMPVLPLTVNGKLDQRSLPAPTYLAAAAYQDAQDPLQEHLARIWKQVLNADRVGIHDNFFELGGDSIAAVRMVGHAREAGLLLTPQMLFQYQTIALLATQMQNPDAAAPSPVEPAATLFDASPYALTPMQEGILFHSYAQRDQGTYLVQCSCEIRGELDEAAFMASWRHALASHDILRTSFALDDNGQAQQTVHRQAALPLAHHDWSGQSVAEQQARLQALLDADHRTDFALDAAPLMRLILVRLGPQQRHLIWTHHHLLMDAWSVDWLLAEVARTYHALAAGQTLLAPAVTPFRDYVAWLHAQDHGRARAWWQDALSGLSEPLLLRRTMKPSALLPGMGRLERSLSAERTAALGRYARSQRVTLNTLVQGALLQALSTLTRQGQPVVGVTVSGRDAPVPGILAMKGLFINTVPLFMDIAHGDEIGAWLRKLQDKNIGLREHAMLPLVEIQATSDVARGTPLFDVIFVFENHPLDERLKEDIRRLGVGDIQSRHRNGYPLTVIVWPEDELRFLVLHEHQHMDDEQAGRLFERLDGLLSDWCRPQPALVGGALWRTPSQAAPVRLA
ncbi:amino acid adenylation enzyme/thioester reductase family protein, partial [Herbaspirillum sp. CF444]|uniref:non-ribosomal peptide synthetase n=1 Tax=Herbaspirillum sp. CF444 TaxID=1144319 RepID=UPI00027268AA